MEGFRDEVAHGRQDVEEDPSLVAARADVDVSHINLLRTGASEHELGGVRRRLEESLEVKASNTVDRLSPAACRRRQPLEAVSSRIPPTLAACRRFQPLEAVSTHLLPSLATKSNNFPPNSAVLAEFSYLACKSSRLPPTQAACRQI